MKRLWGVVTSHLSMICSALITGVSFVGLWYSFWPGIITFALGMGSLILQYRDEKKHESEMALINMRLQMGDIAAQEVFDKPYYGGSIAKQYPSAPATRKPMKLSAPPMK
jgi:hypothetical protein